MSRIALAADEVSCCELDPARPIGAEMLTRLRWCRHPTQEPVFLPRLRSLDLEVNSYFADDFEAVAALPALRHLTVTWQHGFNAPMDEGALDGLTNLT